MSEDKDLPELEPGSKVWVPDSAMVIFSPQRQRYMMDTLPVRLYRVPGPKAGCVEVPVETLIDWSERLNDADTRGDLRRVYDICLEINKFIPDAPDPAAWMAEEYKAWLKTDEPPVQLYARLRARYAKEHPSHD